MSEPSPSATPTPAVEDNLRHELAHGDVMIATARPILRHLLVNDGQGLFSDEVIAKVRGMMVHLARQLVFALGRRDGTNDLGAFVDEHADGLALILLDDADFLAHAHALTIEAQTAERLSQRSGFDSVLSPLLQEYVASSDESMAARAMHVLAAQARFMQQQRRMELPLTELPAELHEKVLDFFAEQADEWGMDASPVIADLRATLDPELRRVAQIIGLVTAMQQKAQRALEIDHAGVAIFVTALHMAAHQPRDIVVLSLSENQCARFALSLRAAGLGQAAVEEQFLFLHPEIALPPGFDTVLADRAIALLAASTTEALH